MKHLCAGLGLLMTCAILPVDAQRLPPAPPAQKESKATLPELVVKAQFVMVMSQREADFGQRPDVDDLQAVGDVESGLRKWGRYKIVYRKEDADLIVSVRRAPGALGRLGGGAGGGPAGRRTPTGLGGDFASAGDHLAVHNAHTGTSSSALWRKSQKDGLATPQMPLVKMFQDEVEKAAAKTP